MKVHALHLHPVKSTAIRPVQQAYVGWFGLRGDREWMVVDGDGEMITARDLPQLFNVVARTPQTDDVTDPLVLSHQDLPDLSVPRPDGLADAREVRMFTRSPLPVSDAGDRAGAWLSTATGRPGLRLVWCSAPEQRTLSPEVGVPGDHATFQDDSPVTVLSTASVRQVNDWVAEGAVERGEPLGADALPAGRFRANILVDGVAAPFAEDSWSGIRIGDVRLRVASGVDRCVMTTIDAGDLSRGPEPIRTLARHRRRDGRTWCAIHLVPLSEGTIRVGDAVAAD